MTQLIAHLVGDFILQSDWMALRKNKPGGTIPCAVHCFTYTLCFLLLTHSWKALLVIYVTHFLIDRFGLARYLVYLKNHQDPHGYPIWVMCNRTGYFDAEMKSKHHESRPIWITVWLTIVTDNTLHLICNAIAIAYL